MIRPRHLLPILALGAVGAVATGCGGEGGQTPAATTLGTPDRPLVATVPPEAGAPTTSSGKVASGEPSARHKRHAGATATKGSTEASGTGEPATSGGTPGYQKLVEGQSKHPKSRFTPCGLVSEREARAILGAPVQQPLEAAQGPTCIYRTQTGKSFLTLAVQAIDFRALTKQLHKRQAVHVSGRSGYCGTYGQPLLYVALRGGRVLTVGAPCPVARQFAARAVAQLVR
jgi:hypothetical protein